MPAVNEAEIKSAYDDLIEYSYNNLSGAERNEGIALCEDLKTYCLEGRWAGLALDYRRAWLGEIIRRVQGLISSKDAIVAGTTSRKVLVERLSGDAGCRPLKISTIGFSQYTVNRHFQSHYVGQPEWVANKEIKDVAKVLRGEPKKSTDLRIRLHLHAGTWVALNNRGFALHCLANVVPRRLAFDPDLSSDETSRMTKSFADSGLRLTMSIPESRRSKDQWSKTIPTLITGIPETRNSVEILYTIRAIGMAVGAAADVGNEIVYNTGP
ncbi:hypothetical protein JWH04_06690 [Xanthomonas melonis]|uniref:hypothetical protein n=1 Tax=Xanthomonas melonis TaxID=56456 RepID=UPI001E29EF03|nr:hypothetical protein [Xanthomonas melonis]MCD0278627.1 hypothetical protein [Xanthomonas melonis]